MLNVKAWAGFDIGLSTLLIVFTLVFLPVDSILFWLIMGGSVFVFLMGVFTLWVIGKEPGNPPNHQDQL